MIAREQALQIARQEYEARGLPRMPCQHVVWGLWAFEVWGTVCPGDRGGGTLVRIRRWDGKVLQAVVLPM